MHTRVSVFFYTYFQEMNDKILRNFAEYDCNCTDKAMYMRGCKAIEGIFT